MFSLSKCLKVQQCIPPHLSTTPCTPPPGPNPSFPCFYGGDVISIIYWLPACASADFSTGENSSKVKVISMALALAHEMPSVACSERPTLPNAWLGHPSLWCPQPLFLPVPADPPAGGGRFIPPPLCCTPTANHAAHPSRPFPDREPSGMPRCCSAEG